jgi:hypothetical protein
VRYGHDLKGEVIMHRHQSGHMPVCALTLALLGGCATPHAATPAATALQADTTALAADSPRTNGHPLYVRFVMHDGRIAAVQTGTPDDSDIMIAFQQHDASGTVVVIKRRQHVATPIKLDLYVSDDGTHFTHASSCPLAGKPVYQMWTQDVAWLAVGGAHLVPAGTRASCD